MAVISNVDVEALSYLNLRQATDEARGRGPGTVDELVGRIAQSVGLTIARRDAREISSLRGLLARLRRHCERGGDLPGDALVVALRGFGGVLDSGLTAARMHDEAERARRPEAVLRDRILDELAVQGAMRPRDIALQLDSGASQVTRVIRLLEDDALVERAATTGGDRRAVEYRLAARVG